MTSLNNKEWLINSLDFLFPPLCLGCGDYTEDEEQVCSQCRNKIEFNNYQTCLNCMEKIPLGKNCPLCRDKTILLFACGPYQPPLDNIIKQFKFKGISNAASFLCDLILKISHDDLLKVKADMVIPIPLYAGRENIRGYNQAEKLAERLADKLDLPVNNDLLRRIKKRKPQARLKNKDRAGNIKGVFSVEEIESDSKRIILVDDVVTSGSTIKEAIRVLKKSGYTVCAGAAVSHAD